MPSWPLSHPSCGHMTMDAVLPAKQDLGPGVTTAPTKVGATQTLGKSCMLAMVSLSITERYRNPTESHRLKEWRVTLLKQFLTLFTFKNNPW